MADQDINSHVLEIINNQQLTRGQKLKALREILDSMLDSESDELLLRSRLEMLNAMLGESKNEERRQAIEQLIKAVEEELAREKY